MVILIAQFGRAIGNMTSRQVQLFMRNVVPGFQNQGRCNNRTGFKIEVLRATRKYYAINLFPPVIARFQVLLCVIHSGMKRAEVSRKVDQPCVVIHVPVGLKSVLQGDLQNEVFFIANRLTPDKPNFMSTSRQFGQWEQIKFDAMCLSEVAR